MHCVPSKPRSVQICSTSATEHTPLWPSSAMSCQLVQGQRAWGCALHGGRSTHSAYVAAVPSTHTARLFWDSYSAPHRPPRDNIKRALTGRFRTARARRGHSAGTAPIITMFIPGTPLQTTRLTEACTIHSTQHRGCGIQDPGTRGYRWWKTADFSHSARCAPFVCKAPPGWPGAIEPIIIVYPGNTPCKPPPAK